MLTGLIRSGQARVRPRLSRTLSRARWREYRQLLETARREGYDIVALEDWVLAGKPVAGRILILRHDVDQHPASALVMAGIEEELGVRSTWYFRWRTASPEVIEWLRARGFSVGLHYETLTRRALDIDPGRHRATKSDLEIGRAVLRAEIEAFAARFGPIRSVCPHGDSRVPGVNNGVLLKGQDCEPYGILFDGNDAMRGTRLGKWLTDRSSAEGGWKDGVDPLDLLRRGTTPILCLAHPNNWASGPRLWADRLATGLLPAGAPKRPIRTLADLPPL
jgi:hypothetical protein